MKKLILIFSLMFSMFTFGQTQETSYIYRNVIIVKDAQTSSYKTPVTVTYFSAGRNVVKVSFNNTVYLYTIVSEPVRKYDDGLYYYQFNVRDSSGNTIIMLVFEDVGRYGCIFSDGKITISYSNTNLTK